MKKQPNSNYDSRFLNQNFRVKVYGTDDNGNRINTLVGFSGIINLIGDELFTKFTDRAVNSGLDVCVCKLRRGLKVSFYSK